jgi:6-pyruvoyltetrahydropterin/6-carboxytetrahydropterin synthase
MGHRLPYHDGQCKHLHGHSYKLLVELSGTTDDNGMVMDYYDVKNLIKPVIDELDHSFMVYERDEELIAVLKGLSSKMVVVGFESTAENICLFFLEKIKNSGLPENVDRLKVRVYETETTYAEEEIKL